MIVLLRGYIEDARQILLWSVRWLSDLSRDPIVGSELIHDDAFETKTYNIIFSIKLLKPRAQISVAQTLREETMPRKRQR